MIRIQVRKTLSMSEGEKALQIETSLETGSFTAIYGRSGAGKTTFLRLLAGLIQPEQGYIEVDGQVWLDTQKKINLPPQKRSIGFVFQDFALFPNMTVLENLQYASGNKPDQEFIKQLLTMVSMEKLAHRKPTTLSGGQKQRIALARALVRRPSILLLDEPLSALDQEMRHKLREEIHLLHRQFQTTTLLVSHDLAEIYRLANKVLIIEEGSISKSGKPDEVFSEKRLSSKIQLTGEVVRIVPGEVVYIIEILTGNSIIKTIATKEEAEQLAIGSQVMVFSKAFNPIIKKL
ncbi:ATP-binding cassette domain-containing protein [Rhodocytophaga aerolata]|uniref:ATP-binding cassette domain-containing protein n=1 Tax=Rhodocytophaga aerolata TaxID=455078 RepID=A0ABT8QZI2_9BACT|nr:ATP-binding cassette domain-containing protein [Rhodocytophaga aerolata]MDO1445251.1 ATP-binding cassette domain-containing protein [Rhodocytophaga aerolata]